MLDAVTHRRTTSLVAVALGGVLLVPGLGGCGSGDPRTVGPSGIDGLVVPSPSPDPADFVAHVDNPWLPLEAGSRWRYRVVDEGVRTGTVTVTVTGDVREVAGVPATVVREAVRDARGALVEETESWFAQDAAGNVWLLGEDGGDASWEAGVAGAAAGLAMPAVPRTGDGFERAHAPGVAEDRTRVLGTDAEVATPAGDWTGVVLTEGTTPREPGREVRSFHARGVGLVREEAVAGGTEVVELVALGQSGRRIWVRPSSPSS